jgi:anti-sigma regulatory factor (Ser/Thr protein kinase)
LKDHLRIEWPLDLEEALRKVRRFVNQHTQAAGLVEDERGLLEVACVEAFTNVVRHGKGLRGDPPMELVARLEDGALVIDLVHLGEAFTPPAGGSETDLGGYPEGGFGLQIIEGASDGVAYLHHQGINILRMTKRVR